MFGYLIRRYRRGQTAKIGVAAAHTGINTLLRRKIYKSEQPVFGKTTADLKMLLPLEYASIYSIGPTLNILS